MLNRLYVTVDTELCNLDYTRKYSKNNYEFYGIIAPLKPSVIYSIIIDDDLKNGLWVIIVQLHPRETCLKRRKIRFLSY